MESKAGIQIGKKAFLQSFLILLTLMILAGTLTRLIPAGQYQRVDIDGRQMVSADSFDFIDRPDYPVWR